MSKSGGIYDPLPNFEEVSLRGKVDSNARLQGAKMSGSEEVRMGI